MASDDDRAAPGSNARSAGWRARLALVAITLALCVLASELVARVALDGYFTFGQVRATTWAPCARWDPDYGWSQRPGSDVRVANGINDYVVHVNRAGFRDPERTLEPAPGVRRIVLLGDSMAWGWGVDEGERFSDLLELRLGPDVEVVSLACPGYGTDQELRLLEERGLAYRPEVVVLGVVLNDVVDATRKIRYGMQKPTWRRDDGGGWTLENHPAPRPHGRLEDAWNTVVRWLSARSALVQWIDVGPRPPAAPDALPADDVLANLDDKGLGPAEVARFSERLTRPGTVTSMLLERLARACDEAGVPLLAFALPHNHDLHLYNPRFDPPEGRGAAPQDVAPSALSQELAEAGRRMAFRTVSIDRALYARAREGVQLDCGDGHYTAAGNAVVADVLEPVLRELLRR